MATRTLQWKSDAQFDFGPPTKVNVETVGSGDAAYLRLTTKTPGSDDVPFTTPANYSYDGGEIEVTGGVAKLKPIPLHPYAWWHFNESSGTNVPDSSGNGRNGICVNMEDYDWKAGKLNNCLDFDGENEHVNCGNIAGFERTDPFSLECWFKARAGSNYCLMSKITNVIGVGYYILLGAVGYVEIDIQNTQANRIKVQTILTGLLDDNWHHVVITYDGSSDASGVHIYIDGEDEAFQVYANNLSMTIINSANFNFSMMKDQFDDPAYYYNGKIDEGVIYDLELTQAEVTSRWNSGTGTESMPQDGYYSPGNYEIAMVTDIQPALVIQWLITTETVTKPANTNIYYKYSIDSGANWNASWLTEPNLEAEIQSIVSSKDGTDKIRFKMQLSTTDIYETPEIDNLNVTSDAGYETSGSYIAIGFITTEIAYWRNIRFETSAPSGTSLVVSLRFATHTLDANSIYAVKNDDDSLDIESNYVQWKVEMTGDGVVIPTLSLLELDYQFFEGLLPSAIDLEC